VFCEKTRKTTIKNRKTAKTSKYLNLQICGTVRGSGRFFLLSLFFFFRPKIDLTVNKELKLKDERNKL
jgi:hypothetical protein